MQPMKVLFVSPSFYPATFYGGPTFINHSLCEALAHDESVDLQVLTTDSNGPKGRVRLGDIAPAGYPITYCRRLLPPDIAPGLWLRLWGMVKRSDVVHLNAVFSFTTLPTLMVCKLLRKPVIWSLHGALQRWQGSRRQFVKRGWIDFCNLLCESRRVVIHNATPHEEAESRPALTRARSALIPYGVDFPKELKRQIREPGSPLRLLYLGRLHPIKGIENLLPALSLTHTQATLEICGSGEKSYEGSLVTLVNQLGMGQRVRFYGQVAGETKENCFAAADVCVVPSFKESFGTVVTEALAHGVPVIAGRGTPWPTIEEVGCGLWVENAPATLAAAIDRAAEMPLTEMGQRGRAWMKREFKWSQVATRMIAQYRELAQPEVRDDARVANCQEAASTARHA